MTNVGRLESSNILVFAGHVAGLVTSGPGKFEYRRSASIPAQIAKVQTPVMARTGQDVRPLAGLCEAEASVFPPDNTPPG
ncbi:MAG TPA: hypothetical protein VKV04_21120 [Verrucomicrobiae bacterium]|nr:hypothetical protein [Verrucomicrobiae bacterium]